MSAHFHADAEARAASAVAAMGALAQLLLYQREDSDVRAAELGELIICIMEPVRDVMDVIAKRAPGANDERD